MAVPALGPEQQLCSLPGSHDSNVTNWCGLLAPVLHNDRLGLIFSCGTDAAVAKLAHLLGIQRCPRGFKEKKRQPAAKRACQSDGKTPVVFFSNLEHHSNCVFWREMDCVSVVRARCPASTKIRCTYDGPDAASKSETVL